MKKNFKTILFCAAALALPLGCQKGAVEERNGEQSGFEVTVKETLKGADDTKTYLTGDSEIAWSDKDTVLVIGKTTEKMIVVPFGTDATHGFLTKISAEMPEPATTGKAYTALYPAAMFPTATATNIAGTLPESYDFSVVGVNPLKYFPLYAQSADKTLEFKSVCGLLEIGLTGVTTVTEIIVSTTSTTQYLAGDFTIDPEAGTISLTGAEQKVTIDCGADGVALNRIAPVRFYIPLVPGTYDNIKVQVKAKEFETDGGACFHTTASMEIKKNTVHVCRFPVERNAIQMYAGSPYWSICNLGATCEDDAASWYGNYYMWGETTPRTSSFTWANYRTIDDYTPATGDATDASVFERYNYDAANPATLVEADDAAVQTWDGWRMPTAEEFTALKANCTAVWQSDYEGTGVAGMLFKSNADDTRTLFFPACGYNNNDYKGSRGYFWSASLAGAIKGSCMMVQEGNITTVIFDRRFGCAIRPVHD